MWSSPALGHDGTIYIPSRTEDDNGFLYAISPDGTLKWKFNLGGYTIASPVIAKNGTIYIVVGACLYAINPDGTLKWTGRSSSPWLTPAVDTEGTIYVGAYAFHPDGSLKWENPSIIAMGSLALGADGTIYGGAGEAGDLSFFALNRDGTIKWTYRLPDHPDRFLNCPHPAIGSDGTVYVVLGDGKLYAFGEAVPPPAQGYINGQVKDASTGKGIQGATVEASGPTTASTTTDSNANYTLALPPGTYTLTASASGYQSQTKTEIKVTTGQTTTVNFSLSRQRTVIEDLKHELKQLEDVYNALISSVIDSICKVAELRVHFTNWAKESEIRAAASFIVDLLKLFIDYAEAPDLLGKVIHWKHVGLLSPMQGYDLEKIFRVYITFSRKLAGKILLKPLS